MNDPGSQDATRAYEAARKVYVVWGVDTEKALAKLAGIPLSLHCWQGDDLMATRDPPT